MKSGAKKVRRKKRKAFKWKYDVTGFVVIIMWESALQLELSTKLEFLFPDFKPHAIILLFKLEQLLFRTSG